MSLSLLVMMDFIIIVVVIVVIIIVSPSLSLSAPPQLLLLPRPCRTPALLLASSYPAPPQFLPSSCPLSSLLCFTILSSAPALLLPCFCPAPALLLVLPTPVWQPLSSLAPFLAVFFFYDFDLV